MKLGAFSVSLTVKDINASITFYKKLGFDNMGGDISQGWCIMKNDDVIIGLFQGMFDKNILTFNPGWDQNAQALDDFEDVRDIQNRLESDGIQLLKEADPDTKGPESIVLEDPDGNQIMFDQHV